MGAMAYSPTQYRPGQHVTDDDGDYQYYWTWGDLDIAIPRWLAEIVEVPLIVRWEIFLIGVCSGLVIAATVFLIAFFSA